MSYQVIARKYRPQEFGDVVGQAVVVRTLSNAITSGRIAHAFLFSGVRGVGKTTTARILAKALNCHEKLSPSPCGKCPSCQEISLSSSVDVQEIDAASNTGVDNIRELRDSVQYGTARDRFKIFIIDEVHMLSNAAFNALLKTLEEPPDHVKFILATTEARKLPVTITSRCQHFEFKPISFGQILERLREISGQEGIQISDFALRAVAEEGRGSMRDAQSALDQLLSFGGEEIKDEEVRALLGVVDEELTTRLAQAVASADRRSLLEILQSAWESGVDPLQLCRELIRHLRNLMVCKAAGWEESLLHLPDNRKTSLIEQAESFSRLDLIRFYDQLNQSAAELKWHSHPSIHLEIALMKLVELARLPEIEDVIGRLGGASSPSVSPSGASAPRSSAQSSAQSSRQSSTQSRPGSSGKGRAASGSAPAVAAKDSAASDVKAQTPRSQAPPAGSKTKAAEAAPKLEADPPLEKPAPAETVSASQPQESPQAPPQEPGDATGEFLKSVREEAPGLFALLPPPERVRLADGLLSIDFPVGDNFPKQTLEKPDNIKMLRDLCGKVCGSAPRVEMRLEEGAEGSQAAEETPQDNPKVKAFLDAFPGKILIEKTPED